MLTILEVKENFIATKVTEKITKDDYEKILPILNQQLREYEKIRWYFEMEDFEGWDLKGFYEEISFDLKHANEMAKIAMVGKQKWTDWLAKLMKPFTSAEVRHFDLSEKEEAKEWIKRV